MAETYLASSDEGMSKLGSPILPDKGPFNALRESLPSLEPTRMNRRETNVGVTPMEVNSRATSLALRSGIPSRRQQTTGDVHQYVPLPVVHVRRSQEDRRPSGHESSSPPGNIEPGAYLSNPERQGDDGGMRKLASSSGNGHNVPGETSVQLFDYLGDSSLFLNSLPSNGTVLAPGRRCDDLLGSYPGASTAQPASSISSVHQTIHNSAYAPAQNSEQNHAHQAVQYAMNPSNYAYQNVMDAPALNFVPNVMNAQAPNVVQNVTNAPVQNFVPNYATQFQQNRNQSTFEHPRPPQHQQGLPVTSHQAGPTPTTVRTTVLEGTGTITAATNQQHPASSSSAAARHPLPCSTPARWKLRGIQEEKEESPTGRQHGSSLGSGKCLLESRKDLREDAKSQGRVNAQNRNHPNQHHHQ
ncbi:hypothetical protein H4Q26_009342 [Puccinia striiformis f. sp. tritici PST-130]|nr:hypothetical protein H4Q26_009342 [Puccinia striiformis f. sp. tritici PST-130]